MGIFRKKRTLDSSLVCLFCSDVDPSWFTNENLDGIPVCTSCNLHLVPTSLKDVLVSGEVPPSLALDPATAISAAFSGVTMLWSTLNRIRKPIMAKCLIKWDAWSADAYPEWPAITQESFLATVGDGSLLDAGELGRMAEQLPYLASICSNFVWEVEQAGKQSTVNLWPKEVMATVGSENIAALIEYLEIARIPISNQPVWILFDRLIVLFEEVLLELSENSSTESPSYLFGADVVLHTMKTLPLVEARDLKDDGEFTSSRMLELKSRASIEPFGPDSPKRLISKSSTGVELLGPFELKVEVVESSLSLEKLTLVHSYSFKVLVSATDSDNAAVQIKQKFFDKFGFTTMQRSGQNWLVNKAQGVNWDGLEWQPRQESSLYSKIVDVKISASDHWLKTAWASRLL